MKNRIILILALPVFCLGGVIQKSSIKSGTSTIQIAVAKSKKKLNYYVNKYKNHDMFIEKINNYTLYMVNINNRDVNYVLKDIRRAVPDAFIISKKNFLEEKKEVYFPNKSKNESKIEQKSVIKNENKIEYKDKTKNNRNDFEYKKALSFYKNGDYEKAYQLFSELFLTNVDDVLINYYLGRSAYETKRYEFAMAAYDRILTKESDNSRVRLELAQTYMKMELYIQALNEFNLVLNYKIPLKVREKVLKKISILKDKKQKHYFKTTAFMAFMYDSNINTTSSVKNFDIYSPYLNSIVNIPNTTKKQSAFIYQLLAVLSHKYKFTDKMVLNTSLTPLLLKYNDFKENDVGVLSVNTYPTYYTKDSIYSLGILFDYVYLGHEKYQKNLFINPKYIKILSKKSTLKLGLKKGRINYIIENDKDADSLEFDTKYKYITDNFGMFSFGLGAGKQKERVSTRTDVSNNYYNLSLSNSYTLPSKYTIHTQFNYKNISYKDKDVNFLSKRKDTKRDYSLGISKAFEKNFMIKVSGVYTINSSNQLLYDYDKYTIKTNFIYNF